MMALSHNDSIRASQSMRQHLCLPYLLSARCSLFSLLLGLLLVLSGCTNQGTSPATAPSTKAQRVYVALGASDTFGLGTDDPYTQNWAYDLAAKLGTRYRFVNLGIPGVLVHQALNVELPIALDNHPDLVTIWLAVNDIAAHVPAASYAHDFETLLSRLRSSQPHLRMAVANVPDLTVLPYFYPLFISKSDTSLSKQERQAHVQQRIREQVDAYNKVITPIVQKYSAILVDLSRTNYDLQNHPTYISQDGLHPTALGYQRLADLFYQALQKGDA
ncbi:MAG: hypothetical protein J2P37_12130 [Ktedonobacteraceae bacterium]|nr:hypothetical protein [Ktedonobacteraceae bacterium]MBO0789333.1 hypothetical protein [Ktedonobacteraceae bacterium]